MPAERPTSPIACRLEALLPEQRDRRSEVLSFLESQLAEIGETDDGMVLRWSGDDAILPLLGEFVRWESRCCPFVRFRIDVLAEAGGIALHLSGRKGVKEFLVATFTPGRQS